MNEKQGNYFKNYAYFMARHDVWGYIKISSLKCYVLGIKLVYASIISLWQFVDLFHPIAPTYFRYNGVRNLTYTTAFACA